jgi:hypothetical protein
MEQDLRVKDPDPARARVNADATAVIPPDGPPAEKEPEKAEAEERDRPPDAVMPAGDKDPEDKDKTTDKGVKLCQDSIAQDQWAPVR